MKAPARELDDNGSSNDAPKKPERPEQDQNPDQTAPRVDSAPPPNIPELSEPPWTQTKRHGAFAGDVATGERRPRLSLVPERVSEPRSHSAAPVFGGMRALVGVIAVVTAAVVGYRWGSAPQVAPLSRQPAPASDRTDYSRGLAVSTADLTVSSPGVKPTAAPSTASAGANQADGDAAHAATGMVTSTAAAKQGDPAEIAFLLKTGAELMVNGDVAAARLMLQHAAEAGSAEAAFALAETYDPLVFKKLGRREAVTLDVKVAQSWYEKARNLGSTTARERIVRLTQLPE